MKTQPSMTRPTLLAVQLPIAILAVIFSLSATGFSQSLKGPTPESPILGDVREVPSAKSGSISSNNANADLLKELQQMRARIEELEKRLRAQSISTSESSSQPATIQNMAANPTAKPAEAQSTGQSAAAKAEPSEPF